MIQNVLHPAGIQASRIGSLWNGYMVALTAVYVIVVLWMLVAVWRSHKNAAPRISEAEERPHAISVAEVTVPKRAHSAIARFTPGV